jgi:hypothetical protein
MKAPGTIEGLRARLLGVRLLVLLAAITLLPGTAASGAAQHKRLEQVRVPFVENCGQLDDRVAFSAPTFFGTVFVTREGKLVYSLPKHKAAGWTLTETLGSGKPRPSGGNRAVTGVSSFHGNDPRLWQSDLSTYDEVRLGEVWGGVAVSLRAHGGNVEKLFTIEPGARVEKIRLRLDGAKSLRVDSDGALVAGTGNGEVRFTPPEAYQEQNGVRHPVVVAYTLHGNRYGFGLGSHDPLLPVIIDPLLQSTYLGGNDDDLIYALATDPSTEDVFVAGNTWSPDFPGTAGGAQTSLVGNGDGFVARLDPTLTMLLHTTYLGGSGDDGINSIAIDSSTGDVLVAGRTNSTAFPGTAGGAQSASGGGDEGFVARFNPALTALLQATYLGGIATDWAQGITIHPTSGEVFVAGTSFSTDFPGTVGGAQPAYGGSSLQDAFGGDAFVARLNPALTTLLQATYLGGDHSDEGRGIAIHPTSGEVLVAGKTLSENFPGAAGGAQPSYGSSYGSGFVARLSPALTTLLQTTYLGGSREGWINAIAIHPSTGAVFVVGETRSTDFPGTAGGAQRSPGGYLDGFVARLDPTLATLLQATYLGGSGDDRANAIEVHPATGEVLVAGVAGLDFPGTAGGAQPDRGEGFAARLDPTLTSLLQSTYLGRGLFSEITAVSTNASTGDVLLAGYTHSIDFPGTSGGAQPTSGGASDGFVARLTSDLAAILSPEALSPDVLPGLGHDGDFILEPGESVPVVIAWKNLSKTTVSATGRASDFTGPSGLALPGATYVIVEDSTSYGPIPSGTNGDCVTSADCYQFSVPIPPGERQFTDWDAEFTETLSTGDYKTWTLHVGDSFTDVPRNHLFYSKIEAALHNGVSTGCGARRFCPDDPVTREQMAKFLANSINGQAARIPPSGIVKQSPYNCVSGGTSLFSDVSTDNQFCAAIHYLAAKDVTRGCGPSIYCPELNVDRGEMSLFIARVLVIPAGGAAIPQTYGPDPVSGRSYSCDPGSPNLHFADVSTSDSYCKHVHYLWAKGVVDGCSATEYCPSQDVSRGAMAKFLSKAFHFVLYKP